MKNVIFGTVGVAGSFLLNLLGGWDMTLQILIILMIADYVSGLVVAGVFKQSKKTETGGLESKAGWKGLCRKCMTLVYVLVAAQIDRLAGTTIIRDAVVIGYACNEALSLLENGGLMGLPYPQRLRDAIEILKNKSEGDEA